MISLLAFVFAACSATACYAASPHCMWTALRGYPQTARIAGFVLAMLSLALWISVFGFAAGLSALLVNLMLALVAQPYLALCIGIPDANVISTETD